VSETILDRSARVRRSAIAIVSAIALTAAVISYNHALEVIRAWTAQGWLNYLVPLLPDGLILLSSVAIYEAARAAVTKPRWAYVGLVLGCVVTVVLNVAAGWHEGWGARCINGFVPVVLLLALEILAGILRRGRAGMSQAPVPAAPDDVVPPLSLDEAIRSAAPFMSQRDLAAAFGVSRTTVIRKLRPVPELAAASTNGSGPDE
jgi:hypothetical protein